MMGHPRHQRKLRQVEFDKDNYIDGIDDRNNKDGKARQGGADTKLDRELESFM